MHHGDGEGKAPRGWQWVLGAGLPRDLRDAVLGDADEEFAARAARDGFSSARSWYRSQALRSVTPGVIHRMRRMRAAARRTDDKGDGMAGWVKDLGVAFRGLRKRPGFALTVLVTLALGIGATTALFGVYRTVFMAPITLPDSHELVVVMERGGFGCCGPASGPDYLDWVERHRSFSGLAALSPMSAALTGLDEPERVFGLYVTASAFDMLDVEPAMGRALLPEDQDHSGVVVLSHRLWQGVFEGRPDVLGQSLEVNGTNYTVVGVMPEDFDVPSPWAQMGDHELYLPFENEALQSNRGSHGYPVIARLADGVPMETAQADMERVMRELAEEYPATNGDRSVRIFTIHEYLFGNVGRQLGIILGAAALVLLIACGNVAGLQLARAAGRESELSVRAALGASRRAVVRLLFSESLLLALAGGLLGAVVALLMVDGLKWVLPPTMPRVDELHLDAWALLFAGGAAAFTAVAFGMLPALMASRTNLSSSLREGGRGTLAPAKERVRDMFIVGQIALGLVLANGAALLVKSYVELRGQEYGFRSEGVVTMAVSPTGARYEEPGAVQNFYDELNRRVAEVPGVASMGTVSRLPLFGGSNGNVWVEGQPPRRNSGEGPLVEVAAVSGDYFETMGIPLLEGRLLLPEDSTTGATGVVINRALAEKAWPGESALGKRFSYSDDPPDWLTVVGVVGDVRQWGPERPAQGQAYFPLAQGGRAASYVVVRTADDLERVTADVRRAVLAVDPTLPPSDISSMSARVERTFAQRRFYTTLIGLFAVAALFLAAAGVYGTVSYFVARRVREMGIRMALGAAATGILGLVVKRGIRLAFFGVVLGFLGVWGSTSVVAGFVYGTEPVSFLTVAAGCAVLVGVTVLASLLPALRAVRVPPVLALRSE